MFGQLVREHGTAPSNGRDVETGLPKIESGVCPTGAWFHHGEAIGGADRPLLPGLLR
jgi:hypothetical protein